MTYSLKLKRKVIYSGKRTNRGCRIARTDPDGTVTRLKLSDSLKLWNHSPSGFEWGYGGSGPAQTALALLLDLTGSKELARQLHQPFKFLVIAGLPREWTLTGKQIWEAVAHILAERQQQQR